MADPIKDKDSLTERLEEDRQKMALQVSEIKKDYNVPNRLRTSIQKNPLAWAIGALLTGFLISRIPARRKKIYVWSGSSGRELPPAVSKSRTSKLWSLAKPVISAYVGREIYKRLKRSNQETAG